MSERTETGAEAAADGRPDEPYLAAAAADRWDVLRYEEEPEPVHRVVPAGAGSAIVTTYERRARSRRRLLLALVPIAAVGLPAAGWLLAGTLGLVVGAVLAVVTAAVIVRRHVGEDADQRTDVPEVADASADGATARSYGLENEATIAEAETYLEENPQDAPDRSPEEALDAAGR